MSKKDKPLSSFESIFTRANANNGRKMPIKTIDGKDTDEWLLVFGSESDIWAGIKADFYRKRIETDEKIEVKIDITPMISGWSFSEDCTPENVQKLFDGAPYIHEAVDFFSRNEANLVKKG